MLEVTPTTLIFATDVGPWRSSSKYRGSKTSTLIRRLGKVYSRHHDLLEKYYYISICPDLFTRTWLHGFDRGLPDGCHAWDKKHSFFRNTWFHLPRLSPGRFRWISLLFRVYLPVLDLEFYYDEADTLVFCLLFSSQLIIFLKFQKKNGK